MRKSFNGLQGIINEELGRYLPSSEAFVFVGKNKIKRHGFDTPVEHIKRAAR